MEHATILSYYVRTCHSDHDPSEEETKQVFLQRLHERLQEYGMSFFAIRVALYWIEKAVTQNPDQHWDRVVQWSLMILNHQKRPKTISTWQFGCPELYPGLRSTGIWNKSQFPWAQKIEAAFEDIKIELLSLKSHMQGFQQYRAPTSASSIQAKDGVGSISHDAGDWNVFYLYLHNVDFSTNRLQCPKTVELIDSIQEQYHHAFFSVLSPNTHITKHHGGSNKKIRCVLPLIVPPGEKCFLRVGNETIQLVEGQMYMFDDSFEHEAWNKHETKSRIVLIFDIWHPDFHAQERKFFQFLRDAHLRQQKSLQQSCHGQDPESFYSILSKGFQDHDVDPAAIWA